ncbi:hypothetical protein D3C86_2022840 [compost metagenome]
MPDVDQDKSANQVFAVMQVIVDHLLPLLALHLAHFGITITGQIDEIPGVVDDKMVDHLRFSRLLRGFGQCFFARQHVDK